MMTKNKLNKIFNQICIYFNVHISIKIIDFSDDTIEFGRIWLNKKTKEFLYIEIDKGFIDDYLKMKDRNTFNFLYSNSNPVKVLIHEITHINKNCRNHSKTFRQKYLENIKLFNNKFNYCF